MAWSRPAPSRLARSEERAAWLFMLPSFVLFAVFTAWPVLSALLICMLIGVAFISAYFEARLAGAAVAILFTASILALTACLLLFFREVMLAATSVQHIIGTRRGA